MQSKGKGLTADQKRWYDAVAGLGSILSGGPAILHHPIGQRAKHNKQPCGVWWIIPLTPEEHRRLHAGETFGYESRKEFEKAMFLEVTIELAYTGFTQTVDPEVDVAIHGYHL